ncbi:MAG: hypothetical protein KDB88_01210 [Flavobacteriales bacterium]|nr:hypothetical protein [Flavobacteriales bacterium]
MDSTPIAVIDLGTNTFNLLVASAGPQEQLKVLHSEDRGVALGRGGVEQGSLTEEAIDRAMTALRGFQEQAHARGAVRIWGIGTSAMRNCRNSDVLVARAARELGISIRIIDGDEEALTILNGVRQVLSIGDRPELLMDIGGGSVEFVLATGHAVMWKHSFELGTTRLLERFGPADPMTIDQELRLAAHIDDHLAPLYMVLERHAPHRLIGSAGSFDSLAELVQRSRNGPDLGEGDQLTFEAGEFLEVKDRVLQLDRPQRSVLPGLPAYRVDTFPIALLLIDRVLNAGQIRQLAWSRYALKEGAAYELLFA